MDESALLRRKLAREIAGRLEAEQLLETYSRELYTAKLEAELADKVKTQMLRNVSHELRTPLHHIVGFSDLLVRAENTLSSEETSGFLKEIHQAGTQLSSVLNQILDMSQLEIAGDTLVTTPTNISTVVTNALSLSQERAQQRGITINPIGLDNQCGQANSAALVQALINILTNAIGFSAPGDRVDVHVTTSDEMISISVCDFGIGMTESEARLAVVPFYQISDGNARVYEGMGLGLSIAERLIELQQGKIIIDSEPNEGTTVTIRIPATCHDENSRPEPEYADRFNPSAA